jgi:plastocyanin
VAPEGSSTERRAEIVMRMRRRLLFPMAALLGGAVAVLPAIAASETTPTISAHNEGGYYNYHSWTPSTATVGSGGVVKFVNPYPETYHGLKFTGGPGGAKPSCTGIPQAATEPTGAFHWEGECTFSASGTYMFVCTVHPEMTGTITVNPNGTTTTTTTTPTTTTTTPATPPPSSEESPLAGSASRALALARSQRGGTVRGTLDISHAGAGGRLEIDLFAQGASLAKTNHHALVRVGRLVRSSLSAGKLSFSVRLNVKARQVVKRHRRLALTVKLTLTPLAGKSLMLTRVVVEHA